MSLEEIGRELLEKLFEKQEHCFEQLIRIINNYKKDSTKRKDLQYLQTRNETLKALWDEFHSNHIVLLKSDDREDKYFQQNTYEKTKKQYEEVLHDMKTRRCELLGMTTMSQPTTPGTSGDGKQLREPYPGQENQEELSQQHKQMMRQQMFNFNAFERVTSKIILDDTTEKWELEDHLSNLKSKWEAIDKIHWELDFVLKGENWNEYKQQYQLWEEKHDRIKKALNQKLWASLNYQKSTPRMEIPEFTGNYNQWISFRDLFVETIHKNPLITKSQKMQHLKMKLKGEPEKLIQHLVISSENYDSAWKIIENRYENKRLLFSSYVNALLSLPTIQQPSAQNIKKLHDTLLECLSGLFNLGLNTETWDPLLVHLLLPKLDAVTYADYIHDLERPRELPCLQRFIEFLEAKFMAYEALKQNQPPQKQTTAQEKSKPKFNYNYEQRSANYKKPDKWTKSYYATVRNCPLCKKDHVLMHCKAFLNMNAKNRNEAVVKTKICKNCLFSHGDQLCVSNKTCKLCDKPHHTLLHDDQYNKRNSEQNATALSSTSRAANHVNSENEEVLLTTVQLQVKNLEGTYVILRALLDQGSQVSLVTENAAQRLRLPRRKMNAVVSGVGTALGNCKGLITLQCKSIHSDFTFNTDALIMKKLINNLPNSTLITGNWDYLHNLKLADPDYNVPGPIDILLGADIYSKIIDDGVLRHGLNSPVAQLTKLGWILSGSIKTFNCLVTLNEIDGLSKFWETEEISIPEQQTTSEDFCERFYTETTERMATGQYVVKMPLKPDVEAKLGKTKPQAISQFIQLEKKMQRQDYFAKLYKQFIEDYIELGHMGRAEKNRNNKLEVYLPHHGVIREGSTTTKLRTVFNASMPTSTKLSLNDLMEKGPNLQREILTLILTWRTYKYALTADIEKMFRAIFLHPDQQQLQKIIWRFSPNDPLKEWQLRTVTYGMKAAPFLAMRTLQQLAIDEGHAYPLAEKALKTQFYMDDVITGHHTIEDAKTLQNQLYCLLRKGGFTLHKWASNEPSILQELTEQQKNQEHIFNFKQEESTKTLGLGWNMKEDVLCFNLSPPSNNKTKLTKRTLLSAISKIYDPLGWIAPITIKAKLLFQNIWIDNIQWDDPVSEHLVKEWETIRSELSSISKINIPRWMNVTSKTIELHGFCDASEKAYACVVYSKTMNEETGEYVITLLTSKTKVAPIKKKITLPRLELCGALLLAKLMDKIKTALSEYTLNITCWMDSQVALAWIQGGGDKWERYITNRTTQITNVVPAAHWKYVKTKENSADCATRGLLPSQLVNFTLWWEGPQWLKTHTDNKQTQKIFSTGTGRVYECCAINKTQNNTYTEIVKPLIERCSSLTRVVRGLAWVLRYKAILCHNTIPTSTTLTRAEVDNANTLLINSYQQENFQNDIENLKKLKTVAAKSKIANLSPFLDNKGTLRVGGRLELSTLPEETKHPAIIPHNGRITTLVIEHAHKQTLHGGVRITLAQTRQRYWIVGGNRAVKTVLRFCVKCHRYKPSKGEQIMGNLPAIRVMPSRPFTYAGVDYTGHVDVKLNRGKGVKCTKGYIAIFICLSTKAVHIELVSDLTSQAFIAALKRMCARRGTPKHIYSDNGTNFIGAAKILSEAFQQYKTMTSTEFYDAVTELNIEWHFLAPRWPTAAGIWEAAVKSMKYHLVRVMGEQKLDFELLTTLLAQIEACLNSRPLCPLSEDPEDLQFLTPGHFLTGSPVMSLPQENLNGDKLDLRNRWKMIEMMHQHLWNRWSKEYLHQLQTRSKWLQPKPNLEQGDLVLVKEDNVPPGRWPMGRIVETHPGQDGKVRVVTIKTHGSNLKRPITKLAPLPKNEYKEQLAHNSDTNGDVPPTKRSHYTTHALGSYVTMMLLTLFTLNITCAHPISNFNLTPLDGNRAIYFDEIGNVQMIHDEWTLLTYYNITTYWQGTAQIRKYIDNLSDLCKRMEDQPCEPVTAQLQHELQQLEDYNALLLSSHLNRRKRGYINGIGNLARTLFGVLDEDFAEKYQQDIEKLQMNENYLLELIKNQTSIVETENDIIKNNEIFMKRQFGSIHEYITSTNSTLTKITYKVEIMATMNNFNAASLTASLILTNLKRTQDMLLNTLVNIYNGHLDAHLFTPKQLMNQLHLIAARISKRLSLPIKDIVENIKDVYKLLYVKARITSSYLLLEVHIPLTSDDEYKIYRTIALPRKIIQQHYWLVTLSSSYIAVNLQKNTYLTLEDKELDHCIQLHEDSYVCSRNHPVFNLRQENAPCEAQILNQQLNLHCNTTIHPCIDSWMKLHKQNRWLFICCNTCQARILCEERIYTTKLPAVGLLDLNEGCALQKKDITLFAYNHFGNELKTNLDIPDVPDMNLQLNDNNMSFNLSDIQMPSMIINDEVHTNLDKRLKLLKNKETLPTSISTHDIHQFSVLYLVVGGIVILALYHVMKRCRVRLCERKTAQSQEPKNDEEPQQSFELRLRRNSCDACPPRRKTTKRRFSFQP